MAELLFNTEEERRQAELLQAEIKKLEQQIKDSSNKSAEALKPLIESLTKLQKQFVGQF